MKQEQVIWMTAAQYAELFGVTTETVRRQARDGRDFEEGEVKKEHGRWFFRQPEDAYEVRPKLVK